MSKVVCRCGFAARDESWPGRDDRIVAVERIAEVARDASALWPTIGESDRLLRCPNCETFILEDENGTSYLRTVDSPPLIRVEAGAPHDSLGRVLLTGELALADIREQKLILTPGLWIRLRIVGTGSGDAEADSPEADGTEIVGTIESAVDEEGEFTDDWAITPGGRITATRSATAGPPPARPSPAN